MKNICIYLLTICCFFSQANIFCAEVCEGNQNCNLESISEAEVCEGNKDSNLESISEDERRDFSLGWGHLTATLFKDGNPFAAYFDTNAYIKGMTDYKEGKPCEITSKECETEFLEILSLIQNQVPVDDEATDEKNSKRSWTLGWHAALQIETEFSNYLSHDACKQGILDALDGVKSPQTLQETIQLLQKYTILPTTSEKTLEENEASIKEMIMADSLVVLDFFNTACAPCMKLKPILEEIQTEGTTVYFLDSLEYGFYMAQEKITVIPTVWIFKDGEKVEEITGCVDKEQILEKLAKYK